MQGPLLLKKGGLSSWKAYYFVLDGRALRSFAGISTEGMPKSEVMIAGVNPREELQDRGKGHKPHRFDFDLTVRRDRVEPSSERLTSNRSGPAGRWAAGETIHRGRRWGPGARGRTSADDS